MRRSASEVIRNLEMRIARLERNATPKDLADFIDFCMQYGLKEQGDLAEVNQKVFLNLIAKNKFGSKGLKLKNRLVMLTGFGEQVLNENMRVARIERKSASWEPGTDIKLTIRDFRDYHGDVEYVHDAFEREDGVVYALVELEDETYQIVRSEDGSGDWEDFGSHDLYRYSKAQDEFEDLVGEFGGRTASRKASVQKSSAIEMSRPPKKLKMAIKAYLVSGGKNTTKRLLIKEKVSPNFEMALKEAKLFAAGMNVFEALEYYMPKGYHQSFEGYGDTRTEAGYVSDLEDLIEMMMIKHQKVRTRAPRGSKIDLQVISARGGKLITKRLNKTDKVFVANHFEEYVETHTAEKALEIQQQEILRHGKPMTEFLATRSHPKVKALHRRTRYLDERGIGMN